MEIEKLRTRLKNISRGVNEYRMTVVEAKALLAEIDQMKTEVKVVPQVIIKEVSTAPKILDGGTFDDFRQN